jgi:hypothetical protein
MSDAPPPPRPRPSAAERAKEVAALLKTIQQEAEEREFVRLQPGPPPRSPAWYGVLVLAVALNAWVWIDRPAWLVGDSPAPAPEARQEQALRLQMYVQGQQIEAFRREYGEPPETLEDAGRPMAGMRYQRAGTRSWELLGESGRLRIILRGSQNMEEFLGSYEDLLGLAPS